MAKELIEDYQKRKELPTEEGKVRDGVRLCCSKSQLQESERQFKVPENLLGRCPTCLENFRNTFCNLACSPGNIATVRTLFIPAMELLHKKYTDTFFDTNLQFDFSSIQLSRGYKNY